MSHLLQAESVIIPKRMYYHALLWRKRPVCVGISAFDSSITIFIFFQQARLFRVLAYRTAVHVRCLSKAVIRRRQSPLCPNYMEQICNIL